MSWFNWSKTCRKLLSSRWHDSLGLWRALVQWRHVTVEQIFEISFDKTDSATVLSYTIANTDALYYYTILCRTVLELHFFAHVYVCVYVMCCVRCECVWPHTCWKYMYGEDERRWVVVPDFWGQVKTQVGAVQDQDCVTDWLHLVVQKHLQPV